MGPGLDLGLTVREAVQVDPDRVLDEMVEACDKAGGWAYWGAWDILGTYARDHEKGFSSRFGGGLSAWEVDLDAGAAEVDGGDQRVG